MNGLLMLLATNAVVATALLGVGLLADRFVRWPAVRHLVWAAVLLQLLLPPVITIGVSLPQQPPAVGDAAVTVIDAPASAAGSANAEASLSARATASAPRSLVTALAAMEITGAALFLGLALTRMRRISQLLRATEPASEALQQRARRLADRLGVRRLPRLRVTDEPIVPMLVALPVPTILLSRPLVEALGGDEADAILCHELAHVRRGDAWLRPVELLATALYWWLPTLWIARRRLRRAEEFACDSLVLSLELTAKRAYAESLLKSIELTTPITSSALVTGSADSRYIKERITMILETSNKPAPRGALWLAAAFALAAMLVGPTWAPAQQPLAQESDEASAASPNQREESQLEERELVETRMRPLRQSLALERELIARRLQAYEIENQIQKLELQNEMARIHELLEHVSTENGPHQAQAREAERSLGRLELKSQQLDVQLSIHRLETELALQGNELAVREMDGSAAAANP